MNSSITHNNYFARTPVRDWSFRTAYTLFEEGFGENGNICDLLVRDLNAFLKPTKAVRNKRQEILQDIEFFKKHAQKRSAAPSAAGPPSVVNVHGGSNETYNYSNVTRNMFEANDAAEKRKTCSEDQVANVKRGKHTYTFLPQGGDVQGRDNSPRVNIEDWPKVKNHFVIALRSDESSVSTSDLVVRQEFFKNIDDQQQLAYLSKRPAAENYISNALKCSWDAFVDFLYSTSSECSTEEEKNDINMIRCILIDFHVNCMKPPFAEKSNERTPFTEYVLPVFKSFGAWTKLVSFLWCEIGSTSQRKMVVCLTDGQRKLLDGIGFDSSKLERVLIESSGEEDGVHTEEDTLKFMECTHHCLKAEMKKRQSASYSTFMKRRLFTIHCVADKVTLMCTSLLPSGKWSFVEVRSADIPRNYESRFTWKRVFELLFKFKEMLQEQEEVTKLLVQEHGGETVVDQKSTIYYKVFRTPSTPS